MRRLVAGLFLIVFALQSSGTALAATDATGKRPQFSVVPTFEAIEAAVVGSQLYADVTGTQDRYAAMHAPAPRVQRPKHSRYGPTLMRPRDTSLPIGRPGTREALHLPALSVLRSREGVRDPRAMRRYAVQSFLTSDVIAPGGRSGSQSSSTMPSPRSGNARSTPPTHGPIKQLQTVSAGTGIAHWWTYEEQPIPGIGKALVNVGTGNLLVSAMDVNVPEQGLNLAFQRTYNSQSLHDANGDDGGDPAIFGNGWTNNFDASIVYSPTAGTITVYDMDGTACTYTPNSSGGWVPCTGQYAQLAVVPGSQGCQYSWTKPNGTIYVFQSYGGNGLCTAQNLSGHLVEIVGRNATNTITFTYYWDSSGIRTSEHITEIDADHSDGDKLVMMFGTVGSGINELKTITRPDGAVLQYRYDSSGNLTEVDKPGNNAAWNLPDNPHGHDWQTGDLPETYVYASGYALGEACGPRCTAATWVNPASPADGAALFFTYANSQLTQWQVQGVLNFTPDDGGNPTQLQPLAPSGWQQWNTTSFQYGVSGPCGSGSTGMTWMCDEDGHSTKWTSDSNFRVTNTSRWAVNQWIPTWQSWDGSNNLISTTDANSNLTQYGYDTSGNMVEMQQPAVTDVTIGGLVVQSFYPLSLYSYDTNNNVVAFCDPYWSNQNGKNWTSNPGDSLCPNTSGTTRMAYTTTDPNEPSGCLSSVIKRGNYSTSISYKNGGCGTGNGAGSPAVIQGALISQFGSNPSRQPIQDFGYNAQGQLSSYDRGADGGNYYDSWSLQYNQNGSSDNLNTERIENDPTIGNKMLSFTCYYPDGSVFYTESPSQHDADGNLQCPSTASLLLGSSTPPAQATAHYYDADGDEIRSISYKGCGSGNNACPNLTTITRCSSNQSAQPIGTTCKYYDGLDRLVETAQPYDTRTFTGAKPYEFYAFRWMNRYIYDLTLSGAQGALSISDNTGTAGPFPAYGNLYKTQEYLHQTNNMLGCFVTIQNNDNNSCNAPSNGQYTSAAWSDIRGASFDSIDRPVGKYELAFGTKAVTTNTYDGSGEAGLLSSSVNAVQQSISYVYDQVARINQTTFSQGDGANRTYSYDPDGRTASISSSFGTMSYTYDVDGNKLSVTEPSKAQNYDGGSFICYEYYPDGMREYLTIGDAAGGYSSCSQVPSQTNPPPSNDGISQHRIFSYAYTQDGRPLAQVVNWGSIDKKFSFAYAPSGRELSENDPMTGKLAYAPYTNTNPRTLQAKTYTYDPYGRISSLTLPGGYQQAGFSYDEDDEVAGFTVGEGNQNAVSWGINLNARGEILENEASPQLATQAETQSANGAQVGNGDSNVGPQEAYQFPPTTLEYDVRSNMAVCSTDPNYASDWINNFENTSEYVSTYDPAGRQTHTGSDASNTCDTSQATSKSTYDAENHVETSGIYKATGTATWGPDGRQRITTGGGNGNATAHWDDGTLLFATGTNLTSPQLYIGKLGIIDVNGNTDVYDRDQSGEKLSSHGVFATQPNYLEVNGFWVDGWAFGTTRTVNVYKAGKQYYLDVFPGTCNAYFPEPGETQDQFIKCPASAIFEMARTDGFAMVGGIVQGARTYDSTTGQWLSPDPSAGHVADPMSQKPFVWNNNNPLAFSDPTGFEATAQGTDGSGAQAQNGPPAGAPGSACAATDSSHACYQDGQDINALPGTQTTGFTSLAAAAAAAASAYSFIQTQGEVGCAVFCNGGDCGFGPASVTRENADGTANLGFDPTDLTGADQGGVWHTHPDGTSQDDMAMHYTTAANMLPTFPQLPSFSVFTSESNMPLQVQVYNLSNLNENVLPSNAGP